MGAKKKVHTLKILFGNIKDPHRRSAKHILPFGAVYRYNRSRIKKSQTFSGIKIESTNNDLPTSFDINVGPFYPQPLSKFLVYTFSR